MSKVWVDGASVALGIFIGTVITMAFAEYHGGLIKSGTRIYPTEQVCIIKTGELCEFNRIGVYTPINGDSK